MYQFTTPTVRYPLGCDRLMGRYSYDVGVSVLKKLDGTYSVIEVPADVDFADASEVYLGGHIHVVDDDEAAALQAAGLGAGLVEL